MPGNNGVPGSPGTPGRDGRDGGKGEKGEVSTRGPAGDKGDKGDTMNWKQCVWKVDDGKDIGLIKVSIFRFPFTGEKNMSVHASISSRLSTCRLSIFSSVYPSIRRFSCQFVSVVDNLCTCSFVLLLPLSLFPCSSVHLSVHLYTCPVYLTFQLYLC